MLLEVQIGLALAAADPTNVRVGGGDHALALEDVQLLALPALFEDPLGHVNEGVSVGIGGHIDDVAEALGELLQRHGSLVGRPTRGLVVQVPEDDHLLLLGGVHTLLVLDHIDVGGVVGSDCPSDRLNRCCSREGV